MSSMIWVDWVLAIFSTITSAFFLTCLIINVNLSHGDSTGETEDFSKKPINMMERERVKEGYRMDRVNWKEYFQDTNP